MNRTYILLMILLSKSLILTRLVVSSAKVCWRYVYIVRLNKPTAERFLYGYYVYNRGMPNSRNRYKILLKKITEHNTNKTKYILNNWPINNTHSKS